MKHFSLLIGAFLIPFICLSQFQIGFFYLPQKTSISNSISDKSDPIYKNKVTFAGGGGLNLTYWFKDNVGLQTGVMYISHNQKFESEIKVSQDSTRIWKGKKRLDYIKFPLLLTYSYPMQKRIHFMMYGGPQLGYLIKGDGAIVVYQHYNGSDYYDLPPSGNNYYNKFVVDIVAGGGLNFLISPELTANASLRIDWSISDTENKASTFYNSGASTYYLGDSDRKKAHNNSIGILVGLTYTFRKNHLLSPSQKWY